MTVALLSVAAIPAGSAFAADHPVTASDFAFAPANLSITQGDKVIWTNAGGTHNVQFTSGGAYEMPASPSSSWATPVERIFTATGVYSYQCELHAPGMAGTITVTASPDPGTPPPGTPPPGPAPPGGEPPPGPGGPGPALSPLKVTLKVSDATPLAGTRVRLSGQVRPARDGRRLQIQRRGRGGAFRTIASTRLRDDGAARSKFSLRLRIAGDAVLRARVAGDDERAAGVSRRKSLDVHRPPR